MLRLNVVRVSGKGEVMNVVLYLVEVKYFRGGGGELCQQERVDRSRKKNERVYYAYWQVSRDGGQLAEVDSH